MPDDADSNPPLNEFQSYLLLLARGQLADAGAKQIDPQEAVQQTLAKAYEKRHQFRGQGHRELAGWLRTILANHLRDLFRRMGRELDLQSLASRLEESSIRLDRILTSEQSSPSQHFVKGEQLQQLAEALWQLPDDQRLAIELRHLQGLGITEIAERMKRSTPSIGGLLQRGLKALREKMADETV